MRWYALLSLALSPVLPAQELSSEPQRVAVGGAPEFYRLDLDSGSMQLLPGPGAPIGGLAGMGSGPVLCLDNSEDLDPDSTFPLGDTLDALISDQGDEFVDWGVKSCGGTRLIERLVVGYASQAPLAAGGSMTIRVYAGTQGFGTLGSEVFSVDLTGLDTDGPTFPSTGLIPRYVELDLGSQAFFLPDGPVGWAYQMGDGLTGPLLVDVGPKVSTQNYLDWYRPGPATNGNLENTFSLGAGGFSNDPFENSLYFQMFENDGAQTADVQLIPSAANLDSLRGIGGPVLSSTWELLFQSFSPVGSYTTIVVLAGEPLQPAFGTSIGDILINVPGTLIATSVQAQSVQHAFDIPAEPSLLGQSIYAQGVTVTSTGEQLTNGLVGTFGF